MSKLQTIIDYVTNHFENNVLVNTVVYNAGDTLDSNKDTVYPLVNVEYVSSKTENGMLNVVFEIMALDQLDIYQSTTDSKLKADTNEPDVRNETSFICDKFINSFNQYNSYDIEMVDVTDSTMIKNDFINGLSGHEFSITLSIPNPISSCQ